MSYLIDTVVLSELRKKNRSKRVVNWFRSTRSVDIFLSVVTIGEIERGIKQQQRNNEEFSQELAKWLDGILLHYTDRILPVSINVARRWGTLSAEIGNSGADILIAATALEHGLSVVTRNQRHFTPTGVPVVNPF
ncbi:MAG: type II toxin-antitoxin system VapC family toxin [Thermodesulfobacteriota bacterium]|nr:type II toxin-antitoxin system VapC family toxin [Thermodesulfobacteriota bacterium]